MAGYERAAIVADDDEQFDTKSLMRLVAWGLAAFLSLALTLAAARSDLGGQRLGAALKAIASSPDEAQSSVSAQLLAHTAAAERDARRAADTMAAISADRERMIERVNAAERGLAELNGAVQHALAVAAEAKAVPPPLLFTIAGLVAQPKYSPPAGWAVAATDGGQSPAASHSVPPAAVPAPVPQSAAMQDVRQPPTKPPAPASVAHTQPLPPQPATSNVLRGNYEAKSAVVNEPAASPAASPTATGSIAPVAEAEPAPKVEFGVDLGPALTTARLRARWAKLAGERPELIKGLRPLVTVHDTAPGKPVEVRLLAGPLVSVAAATEFCQALASPHYVCRPSVFDGQRLPVP